MSPAATKPRATGRTADPLADLRGGQPIAPPAEPEPEAGPVPPSAAPEFHRDAVGRIVQAFHADAVAAGTLHKGGTCACQYLATKAVRIVLGSPVPDGPQDDG